MSKIKDNNQSQIHGGNENNANDVSIEFKRLAAQNNVEDTIDNIMLDFYGNDDQNKSGVDLREEDYHSGESPTGSKAANMSN